MSARPFLTARWSHLVLVTWAVPPARLEPLLPPGLALDTRDGHAFVSFVAFDFEDTRVLGVRWPFHVNFPEVNLRYYVREPLDAASPPDDDEGRRDAARGYRRGVAFVRELVPRFLVAAMARWLYDEPYQTARMRSAVTAADGAVEVAHALERKGARATLRVVADDRPERPAETSDAHFFKEHRWGYGQRKGRLLRYEVLHPVWDVLPIRTHALEADFAGLYGPEWGFLAREQPHSTVLAVGSDVRVSPLR